MRPDQRATAPLPLRRRAPRRRGSILLLVLAILAVLGVLVGAMSFTAGLEAQTVSVSVEGAQAAAETAGAAAVARRFLTERFDEPTVPLAPAPDAGMLALARDDRLATSTRLYLLQNRAAPRTAPVRLDPRNPWLRDVQAWDLSGRIDLNAVAPPPGVEATDLIARAGSQSALVPWKTFESLVAMRMRATKLDRLADPAEIARACFDHRLAALEETSSAKEESEASGFEPLFPDREAGPGEARPVESPRGFEKPGDLLAVPGMTPQLFAALEPVLTPISASFETWRAEGERYVRVNANRASVEEILAVLETLYPRMDERRRFQYAANVVDARDDDRLPTVLEVPGSPTPVLGLEKNVCITEVCPDVLSFDGSDEGEFIELHNPLDETVDLARWTLEWSGGAHTLYIRIPAKGHAVFTDDPYGRGDEERRPGMGSFYDCFQVLPSRSGDSLNQIPGLDLPDEEGQVRLLDPDGRLVDVLTYRRAHAEGLVRSYVKTTYLSREGRVAAPTPFTSDLNWPERGDEARLWSLFLDSLDRPLAGSIDLMQVPVCEALERVDDQDVPVLVFPLFEIGGERNEPDLRLLDVFTVADVPEAFDASGALKPWGPAFLDEDDPQTSANAGETPVQTPADDVREPFSHGRINLNTAPVDVLAALPGLDRTLAERIDKTRQDSLDQDPAAAPFRTLADFASDEALWSGLGLERRREILAELLPLAAVNTAAYRVLARRASQQENSSGRPACQSIFEIGAEGSRLHAWGYVHPFE